MVTRVQGLPRRPGAEWKIEAPGCVVYLRPNDEGGTTVDVECDGDRYREGQFATVRVRANDGPAEGVCVSAGARLVRVAVAPAQAGAESPDYCVACGRPYTDGGPDDDRCADCR